MVLSKEDGWPSSACPAATPSVMEGSIQYHRFPPATQSRNHGTPGPSRYLLVLLGFVRLPGVLSEAAAQARSENRDGGIAHDPRGPDKSELRAVGRVIYLDDIPRVSADPE